VNPALSQLWPYPFERLNALLAGAQPPKDLAPVALYIGEPRHAPPAFLLQALTDNLRAIGSYPLTAGTPAFRAAVAGWLTRRFKLPAGALHADSMVLPANGTREALFAFVQAVTDRSKEPLVVMPNPFYQIYEGAALLAGAEPIFLNQTADHGFGLDLDSVSADEWRRTQMMYVCSPGNPTGRVLTLDDWRALFERSDRYGFVIASDECYSEIYGNEDAPPLGGLEAAHRLGRDDFRNLLVFTSLSKRSNAPGLRSGGVAGDARLLRPFLLYRTYHGCAMSLATQHASIAAWGDEAHVRENRKKYREKFAAIVPILEPVMHVRHPDAGFYLWAGVPPGPDQGGGCGDDVAFTRELFAATHVTVLPGRYLGREAHGVNPGCGYVRMALVPEIGDCVEAARRIVEFCG